MKIKFIESNIFDVYIIKDRLSIDFNNKKEVDKYLKDLFKILSNNYEIGVEGFYDVVIYIDKYYGIIIHVEKTDYCYYNGLEMNVSIVNTVFLYKLDELVDNTKIHIIDNNMYLEIICNISNKDMMYLIEHSDSILYNYSK